LNKKLSSGNVANPCTEIEDEERENEENKNFDNDFISDIEMMEGLYDKPEFKTIRKLAELNNHE
jgi:WD40 repeat protein